jgi:hypothetical protein
VQNPYIKGLVTANPLVGFVAFLSMDELAATNTLEGFVALHTTRPLKWNNLLFIKRLDFKTKIYIISRY